MATKQQEAPSVEETLNKTDLGQIINDNKRPIMITGAIIIALIIAYSIMVQVNANNTAERLDKTFKARTALFSAYLDGSEKAPAFKEKLLKMENSYHANANFTPDFLNSLNQLVADKAMDKPVLDFAVKWIGKMNKKSNLYVLSGLRVSALLEDNNREEEAITILQGMLDNKVDFLTDKIQFDLGRMLMAKGDKEKAKTYFQKVAEATEESEFKSMAKIYLNE